MNKGAVYEDQVYKALNKAAAGRYIEVVKPGPTFSNRHHDLILVAPRWCCALEVKHNSMAQMGGTSVHYDENTGEIKVVGKANYDPMLFELVNTSMNKRVKGINKLMRFLRSQSPVHYHREKVNGFPLRAYKDAWTRASEAGMLKEIRTVIKQDISFITDHYAAKDVHYMQIGGSGLFYLDENTFKLPVPKLEGKVGIEIRPAPGGSVYDPTYAARVVGVELRVTARLMNSTVKSGISLDNLADARTFIGLLPQ